MLRRSTQGRITLQEYAKWLVLFLTAAALATASALPLTDLRPGYLPPSKPYRPPVNSYLPPPSDYYLPPHPARRSDVIEQNLVDTGSPEEAVVEEQGYHVPDEAADVAEESASGVVGEADVPVEDVVVDVPAEETVGEGAVEEVESGSQQPKFTSFYDDEDEEDAEQDSLKVDQLHGVAGSYKVHEEGEGYRNTDAREESKLYQNVEDVKTFNSEVHEYEYYPYESYGKEVTVVEPIIGKTYGFHAVPHRTSHPGYGPLRSVSYLPVQYPAYRHGPAYRPPPGYTASEPSYQRFPDDGTRYIARPPRPSGDSRDQGTAGQENHDGSYGRWPVYNAQAAFPATSGFPAAPVFAGGFSSGPGYESQGAASSEERDAEVETGTSRAEVSTDDTAANEAETSAEVSPGSTVVSNRRSSSGEIPNASPYRSGFISPHVSLHQSPNPARRDVRTPPAPTGLYHLVPAASTSHGVYSAPPAASQSYPGLSRRRSITGGRPRHPAVPAVPAAVPGVPAAVPGVPAAVPGIPAVPPVEHGLVYADGAVVPRGTYSYGDGVGSRHVREGNIPGYYVRCVRHDSGPPSVSLVPFAQ